MSVQRYRCAECDCMAVIPDTYKIPDHKLCVTCASEEVTKLRAEVESGRAGIKACEKVIQMQKDEKDSLLQRLKEWVKRAEAAELQLRDTQHELEQRKVAAQEVWDELKRSDKQGDATLLQVDELKTVVRSMLSRHGEPAMPTEAGKCTCTGCCEARKHITNDWAIYYCPEHGPLEVITNKPNNFKAICTQCSWVRQHGRMSL